VVSFLAGLSNDVRDHQLDQRRQVRLRAPHSLVQPNLKDPLEFRDILRSREFFRSGVGYGGHGNVEANGSGAWSDGEDPAAARTSRPG
jgi:hypothetical protein